MSESIDQNTENYKEEIIRIQTGMKGFNTQVTKVDKEVDPVEWRLTNQIKDVKRDINVVKDDLTVYINQVKTDLKDDINQVKTDLKDDIQSVRGEVQRSEFKSDMKKQLSSLKRFIGIFMTAGFVVIGAIVILIPLFVK